MSAETVTTYVVQAELSTGWADASTPQAELDHARAIVRTGTASNARSPLRVIERRVTTVEEVVP